MYFEVLDTFWINKKYATHKTGTQIAPVFEAEQRAGSSRPSIYCDRSV